MAGKAVGPYSAVLHALEKNSVMPILFGQMLVWDAEQVLAENHEVIKEVLSGIRPEWVLNLISISEKKSYFVTTNSDVQLWLSDLLGANFVGSVGVADGLWLRKEIIKRDSEKAD